MSNSNSYLVTVAKFTLEVRPSVQQQCAPVDATGSRFKFEFACALVFTECSCAIRTLSSSGYLQPALVTVIACPSVCCIAVCGCLYQDALLFSGLAHMLSRPSPSGPIINPGLTCVTCAAPSSASHCRACIHQQRGSVMCRALLKRERSPCPSRRKWHRKGPTRQAQPRRLLQ